MNHLQILQILYKNRRRRYKRMEEKIEEQKGTIRQEVIADVLARLQRSRIDIDANIILAALGDNSSGEASSAQQTTLQPIRHPSTGSNKEGQLILGATVAVESSDEDLT